VVAVIAAVTAAAMALLLPTVATNAEEVVADTMIAAAEPAVATTTRTVEAAVATIPATSIAAQAVAIILATTLAPVRPEEVQEDLWDPTPPTPPTMEAWATLACRVPIRDSRPMEPTRACPATRLSTRAMWPPRALDATPAEEEQVPADTLMSLARIPAAAVADTTPTLATRTVPPAAVTMVATRATLLAAEIMEVVAMEVVPWSNVVAPVLPAVSTCVSTATRRAIGPPHAPSRRTKGSATRAANEVMRNEIAPREDRSTMETPVQRDSNSSRRRNSRRCLPRKAAANRVEQEDADEAARVPLSRNSSVEEEVVGALDLARARAAEDDRLRRVSKRCVSS